MDHALKPFLMQQTGLEPAQFEVWTEASVASVASALLLVIAVWSGPSMRVTKLVADQVRQQHPRPRFLLVDNDEISDPLRGELGLPLHGKGELFWIVDGRVVHAVVGQDAREISAILDGQMHLLQQT